MPVLTITNNVQGVLSLGSVIGSVASHSTKSIELTVAEIEASKDQLVSLQASGTISWEVQKTTTTADDAAEFMPASNSSLSTSGPRRIYVDDATGNDNNSGERLTPLASIVAAEALIPDTVKHEVIIEVAPHGGAGYVWPTFRARMFSGPTANIFIYFPEIVVVSSGDTAQGGTIIELLVTSGGLSIGALDGQTIEILDGAAQGDRRTIRNNDTTDIVPCAEFSAVPTGASYRIIDPDPGNLIVVTAFQAMVQGMGFSDRGAYSAAGDGDPATFDVPGVTLINAIMNAPQDVQLVADARFTMLGCQIDSAEFFQRMHGTGQFLMGRHSWNVVIPPSTLAITDSSWVGWGVHFTGGHQPAFGLSATPYVSGYLVTSGGYLVFGGSHDLDGHIKGSLVSSHPSGGDRGFTRVTFGKAGPFFSGPAQTPGKISADADVGFLGAAVCVEGPGAYLLLGDETALTNLGTGPVIRVIDRALCLCELQIALQGTNGGDGVQVKTGGLLHVSDRDLHVAIDLQGTVAGQLFSIGPRNTNADPTNDLFNKGDFVSGARGFWDEGLTVTTHVVVLTTIGTVVSVEATVGSTTGPKLLQNSATPDTGNAQVVYDATGIATITFNTADAVTEADVFIQPIDDGTLVQAV